MATEPRSTTAPCVDGELMPQRQVLEDEISAGADRSEECCDKQTEVEHRRASRGSPILCYLRTDLHLSGFAVPRAIRKVATRVIDRLSCIHEARPGALRRLRAYAARGELPVQVDVPDGFSRLFPERWDGSDEDGGFGGWERRTSQEVRLLAEDLHERSPDEIAALITVADAEARAAGISYPRLRRIREARR